jgi:hypothetical protein
VQLGVWLELSRKKVLILPVVSRHVTVVFTIDWWLAGGLKHDNEPHVHLFLKKKTKQLRSTGPALEEGKDDLSPPHEYYTT